MTTLLAEWKIAEKFIREGSVLEIESFGKGRVNDTYLVTSDRPEKARFILQRINRDVFPRPEQVMGNLSKLVRHVQKQQQGQAGDWRDLRFPDIYRAEYRKLYFVDTHGAVWRALSYIENTQSLESLAGSRDAEEIGYTLGRFHRLVEGLDPKGLFDTLPGFHITPRYLNRYFEVFQRPLRLQSSADLKFSITFVEQRKHQAGVLERAKAEGKLSLRVIHGDPKLDNILFDTKTRRAVSIIDLDTVKPGLVQYDIGDCLRSCCNRSGEDPDRTGDVEFDLDLCRSVLKGYFPECRNFLTDNDRYYLYDAIRLLSFELGLRFLTDYLEGDKYFKVEGPDQNLHRAVTQFRLCASIESQEDQIRKLVVELAGE